MSSWLLINLKISHGVEKDVTTLALIWIFFFLTIHQIKVELEKQFANIKHHWSLISDCWLTVQQKSKNLKYAYFEICFFIIFIMDKVIRKSFKVFVLSLNRSLVLCIYMASININRTLIKLEKMVFQYLSLFLLVCEYVSIQKGEQIMYLSTYICFSMFS